MGFGRKGGVVVGVWWFLLLAGVLQGLALAAAGAEQKDGAFGRHAERDDHGNDMCDIKCQHHGDPARRQQCVDECHSREHHHPSRAFCEMKCQHHQDPARKEICVQQCMNYGLNLHVTAAGIGMKQEDGAGATATTMGVEGEVGRHADDHGNDMCDIKCQHHGDPARRQQCVDECHSREHHHPSREFCEMKCQHHQDPARKELCVQQCMAYGLNRRGWKTVAGAILEVV